MASRALSYGHQPASNGVRKEKRLLRNPGSQRGKGRTRFNQASKLQSISDERLLLIDVFNWLAILAFQSAHCKGLMGESD